MKDLLLNNNHLHNKVVNLVNKFYWKKGLFAKQAVLRPNLNNNSKSAINKLINLDNKSIFKIIWIMYQAILWYKINLNKCWFIIIIKFYKMYLNNILQIKCISFDC